jgi:hypothetical protein
MSDAFFMVRAHLLSVVMLSVIMLSVILCVIMLSVFKLSVVMLSVFLLTVLMLSIIILRAFMLSVVVPLKCLSSGQPLLDFRIGGSSTFVNHQNQLTGGRPENGLEAYSGSEFYPGSHPLNQGYKQ